MGQCWRHSTSATLIRCRLPSLYCSVLVSGCPQASCTHRTLKVYPPLSNSFLILRREFTPSIPMASRRTALWHLIACAVVLSCFTTAVNADFYDKSSGIVDLNSKNFDELVTKGGGVWLVEFYAPCKRVRPRPGCVLQSLLSMNIICG